MIRAGKEVDAVNNGAYLLDFAAPEERHNFDVKFCVALDALLKDKDVLDLGAGIGQYGRCLLRIRRPLYTDKYKNAEEFFQR